MLIITLCKVSVPLECSESITFFSKKFPSEWTVPFDFTPEIPGNIDGMRLMALYYFRRKTLTTILSFVPRTAVTITVTRVLIIHSK